MKIWWSGVLVSAAWAAFAPVDASMEQAMAFVPGFKPSSSSLVPTSSSSFGDKPNHSCQRLPLAMVPLGVEDSLWYSASSSSSSVLLSFAVPLEAIQTAFSVATFLPQVFWLFLIVLPHARITQKLMGGMEAITLCCLVHFFIVLASISQPDGTAPMAEFSGVFDPSGNPQAAMVGMMKYPNFVSEEWSHVLTWDLFVGRWIWLDGLERGVVTSHSVLLCNLIGPPGLLLHGITCAVFGTPQDEET